MGRKEIYNHDTNKAYAYGIDHAVGFFLMIWDTTKCTDPDEDNILFDKDEKFDNLNIPNAKKVLQEHGFKTIEFLLGISL